MGQGYRIAVFDTETTGLPKKGLPLEAQPHIIEFGVAICDQDYNILTEKEWLVKPIDFRGNHITITPEMTKHAGGITDDMVFDQKPFAGIYPELTELFLGVKGLVAHNLQFDMDLLKFALMRISKQTAFPYPPMQICTVQATMQFRGWRLSMEKLYKHLFKKEKPTEHRALADVRNLVEICAELKKQGVL